MCLTLDTATDIGPQIPPGPCRRGYTCTRHHAGRIEPGDLFRPAADEPPRTAVEIHRNAGRVRIVDHYGDIFTYLADQLIPTAVPDVISARPAGDRPS